MCAGENRPFFWAYFYAVFSVIGKTIVQNLWIISGNFGDSLLFFHFFHKFL